MQSQILDLPKIGDPRGNLSIIEQKKQIPFEIKRVALTVESMPTRRIRSS